MAREYHDPTTEADVAEVYEQQARLTRKVGRGLLVFMIVWLPALLIVPGVFKTGAIVSLFTTGWPRGRGSATGTGTAPRPHPSTSRGSGGSCEPYGTRSRNSCDTLSACKCPLRANSRSDQSSGMRCAPVARTPGCRSARPPSVPA